MAGISDFLESLSETGWDTLLMVSQDLQDSTAPGRIRNLESYAKSLRDEIDEVNRKRDALGQKVDNLDDMLDLVDARAEADPDDMEMSLLRDVLLGWRASLRAEIEALRPDEKLRKKYDTERKHDLLKQLRTTVEALNRRILEANPSRKAQVTCAHQKVKAR